MTKQKRPVIACDVDLCVVDVSNKWKDYLDMLGTFTQPLDMIIQMAEDEQNNCLDYNLSKYYPDIDHTLYDVSDFWRQEDLYDGVECFEDAKEVLRTLYEKYNFEIVFISYCMDCGRHATSKANMLREQFDFIKKEDFHFCQTRSKGVLSAAFDYAVDDRNEFLSQYTKDVTCFKMETPYTQDAPLNRHVWLTKSWYDILHNIRIDLTLTGEKTYEQ